jgi:hypothetical protein
VDRYGVTSNDLHARRGARQAIVMDFHVFAPHRVWVDETRNAVMSEAARTRCRSTSPLPAAPGTLPGIMRRGIAMTLTHVREHQRANRASRGARFSQGSGS